MIFQYHKSGHPNSHIHAKPVPHIEPWGADVISLTENQIGGVYSAGLDSTVDYFIYYGSPELLATLSVEGRLLRIIDTVQSRPETQNGLPVQEEIDADLHLSTITVLSELDQRPLENSIVRSDGSESDFSIIRNTNQSGETFFYSTAGNYRLAIRAPGHTITYRDIEVSEDSDYLFELSPITNLSKMPNQVIAFTTCFDGQGNPAPNLTCTFKLISVDDNDPTGETYSTREFKVVSDVNGFLETFLIREAQYSVRAGNNPRPERFTTPDRDSFELPKLYA